MPVWRNWRQRHKKSTPKLQLASDLGFQNWKAFFATYQTYERYICSVCGNGAGSHYVASPNGTTAMVFTTDPSATIWCPGQRNEDGSHSSPGMLVER